MLIPNALLVSADPAKLPALLDAVARVRNQRVPAPLAARLHTVRRKLTEAAQVIEDVRVEKVREYGAGDGAGNYRVVETEALKSFHEDFGKLLRESSEVDLQPLSLAEWGERDTDGEAMDVLLEAGVVVALE